MSAYEQELDNINRQLDEMQSAMQLNPRLQQSYAPVIERFNKRKRELEARQQKPVETQLGLPKGEEPTEEKAKPISAKRALIADAQEPLTDQEVDVYNKRLADEYSGQQAEAQKKLGVKGVGPVADPTEYARMKNRADWLSDYAKEYGTKGIDGEKAAEEPGKLADKLKSKDKEESEADSLKRLLASDKFDFSKDAEERAKAKSAYAEEKASLERGELADLIGRKLGQFGAGMAGVDISKQMAEPTLDWATRRKEAAQEYERTVGDIDQARKAQLAARGQEFEQRLGLGKLKSAEEERKDRAKYYEHLATEKAEATADKAARRAEREAAAAQKDAETKALASNSDEIKSLKDQIKAVQKEAKGLESLPKDYEDLQSAGDAAKRTVLEERIKGKLGIADVKEVEPSGSLWWKKEPIKDRILAAQGKLSERQEELQAQLDAAQEQRDLIREGILPQKAQAKPAAAKKEEAPAPVPTTSAGNKVTVVFEGFENDPREMTEEQFQAAKAKHGNKVKKVGSK